MSAAAPLAAFAAGSNICFAQPPHGHDPGSYEELARMAAANRIQRLGQYGQNSVAIAQGVAAGFGKKTGRSRVMSPRITATYLNP